MNCILIYKWYNTNIIKTYWENNRDEKQKFLLGSVTSICINSGGLPEAGEKKTAGPAAVCSSNWSR